MRLVPFYLFLLFAHTGFGQPDKWYTFAEAEKADPALVYKISERGRDIVIPPAIDKYVNLEVLSITGVKHTNEVPKGIFTLPESITKLSKLKYLDLGYNSLTEIPTFVAQLSTLEKLVIVEQNITDLPDLSALKKLKELTIQCNKLAVFPAWICQLAALEVLRFHGTSGNKHFKYQLGWRSQVRVLPDEIGQLRQLKELDISFSQISSLPATVDQCLKLENIDFQETAITTLEPVLFKLANNRDKMVFIEYSKGQIVDEKSLNYLKDKQAGDADVFIIDKTRRTGPSKSMFAKIQPNYKW